MLNCLRIFSQGMTESAIALILQNAIVIRIETKMSWNDSPGGVGA